MAIKGKTLTTRKPAPQMNLMGDAPLLDHIAGLPAQIVAGMKNEPRHTRGHTLASVLPCWTNGRPSDYASKDGTGVEPVERPFTFRGHPYMLQMSPAAFKSKGGTNYFFPGDREQRIEMLVCKLAIDNMEYAVKGNTVSVNVRAVDIFNELASLNCGATYAQIIRSIEILARTRLAVSRVDLDKDGDKVETVMEATFFPVLLKQKSVRKQKVEQTVFQLQLNPLISESIKDMDHYLISFDMQVRLNLRARVVYRWLHYALCEGMIGEQRQFVVTANEINTAVEPDKGEEWRPRDFRKLTKDLTSLQDEGVLTSIAIEDIYERTAGRNKLVDQRYTMTVSEATWAQSLRARGGLREIYEEFERLSGVKAPTKDWAPIKDEERQRILSPDAQIEGTVVRPAQVKAAAKAQVAAAQTKLDL